MAPFKWDDIRVEPLNSDHNFSEFFCASEDLNDFIKNDARREQECMLSYKGQKTRDKILYKHIQTS